MTKDINWVNDASEKIIEKMRWVSEKSKYKIPYTTRDGIHDNCADDGDKSSNDINWWTNGFWGGMMWLLHHKTREDKYKDIARFSQIELDRCFVEYYGLHHDVGFMWLLTSIADYRLTRNGEGRRRGMHAANLLAGRFNPVGRFIRAWNGEYGHGVDNSGWAIIDSMMNLPLLYFAYEETKDLRYKHIAVMHADTVMNAFIREDGSVRHIVEFDTECGGFKKEYGGQGYEEGSSWTRGQAWGLYGFLLSYLHTKNITYLNAAKRIAHYFIANIPEDGIIPVDFRQPKKPSYEDSSAAAIASCGLIEISKVVPEHEKELYYGAAVKMLEALYKNKCDFTRSCDHIVNNCTAAYHDKDHHFSVIYGDYFFIEAIFKLQGEDILLW